jgi:hypothetical protein
MWLTLGMAGAGALQGVMNAKANREAAGEHDKYRKAALEHSYWTGMRDPGDFQGGNQSMFRGALSGGLQGASTGASMASLANAAKGASDAVAGYQGIGPSQLASAPESSWNLMEDVNFSTPEMGPAMPSNYTAGTQGLAAAPNLNNMGPVSNGGAYAKMLNPAIDMQAGRHSELSVAPRNFGAPNEPINMYAPELQQPYNAYYAMRK